MSKEIVVLPSPGSLPGIPGESHGPGVFLVDWDARTITEVLSSGQEDVQVAVETPPVQEASAPTEPAPLEEVLPPEQPAVPEPLQAGEAPSEQPTEPAPIEGGN